MKATKANYKAMFGISAGRTKGGRCVGNCR